MLMAPGLAPSAIYAWLLFVSQAAWAGAAPQLSRKQLGGDWRAELPA